MLRATPVALILTLVLMAGSRIPAAGKKVMVQAVNELDIARPGETMVLTLAELGSGFPAKDPRSISVFDENAGRELLGQGIDLNGDSIAEQLVFQADFAPRESKRFILSVGARRVPRRDEYRVYGRFARERYEDFAWENDRIAHRMYGTALETWEQEPLTSSGVDMWCKRTARLVINDWYMLDDYHQDNGEGGDFYSVGRSRGCGGSGLWEAGRLWVSRNFVNSKVITNGPIRLIFELTYAPWDVNGRKVSEVKRITLDAGHNLDRFESFYKSDGPAELTQAAGIKKAEGSTVRIEKERGWMRTWEPLRKGTFGNLGCGIVLEPEGWRGNMEAESNHLIASRAGVPYYAGFCWDRGGHFRTTAEWDSYLEQFSRRVQSPIRASVLSENSN
jgi:pectinesterase